MCDLYGLRSSDSRFSFSIVILDQPHHATITTTPPFIITQQPPNNASTTTTTKPRHLNNHSVLTRHTFARGLAFDEGRQAAPVSPPPSPRTNGAAAVNFTLRGKRKNATAVRASPIGRKPLPSGSCQHVLEGGAGVERGGGGRNVCARGRSLVKERRRSSVLCCSGTGVFWCGASPGV